MTSEMLLPFIMQLIWETKIEFIMSCLLIQIRNMIFCVCIYVYVYIKCSYHQWNYWVNEIVYRIKLWSNVISRNDYCMTFGYCHYFCNICFKRIINKIKMCHNYDQLVVTWLELVRQILTNISVLRMFNFKTLCCNNIIWKSIFGTPWTKCANPVTTTMTLPICQALIPPSAGTKAKICLNQNHSWYNHCISTDGSPPWYKIYWFVEYCIIVWWEFDNILQNTWDIKQYCSKNIRAKFCCSNEIHWTLQIISNMMEVKPTVHEVLQRMKHWLLKPKKEWVNWDYFGNSECRDNKITHRVWERNHILQRPCVDHRIITWSRHKGVRHKGVIRRLKR